MSAPLPTTLYSADTAIKIAFTGTRAGDPRHFPVIERLMKQAVELALLRREATRGGYTCRHSTINVKLAHGASPNPSCLDWDAEKYARQQEWAVERFAPTPHLDGTGVKALFKRSFRMIRDFKPDVLVAMPLEGFRHRSRGTHYTIECACIFRVATLVEAASEFK